MCHSCIHSAHVQSWAKSPYMTEHHICSREKLSSGEHFLNVYTQKHTYCLYVPEFILHITFEVFVYLLSDSYCPPNHSILSPNYCKSGNIRSALIFTNFAQNSASANSKPHENICDILYAHFVHIGVEYWPCVLMQIGNILKNVWGLLCFCAAPVTCILCIIEWC